MTPNVQLYSAREYPRLGHAKKCSIHASLGMPIIDPLTNDVVAVFEVASNTPNLSFTNIISNLCKSLWQFGLKSLDVSRSSSIDCYLPVRRPRASQEESEKRGAGRYGLSFRATVPTYCSARGVCAPFPVVDSVDWIGG